MIKGGLDWFSLFRSVFARYKRMENVYIYVSLWRVFGAGWPCRRCRLIVNHVHSVPRRTIFQLPSALASATVSLRLYYRCLLIGVYCPPIINLIVLRYSLQPSYTIIHNIILSTYQPTNRPLSMNGMTKRCSKRYCWVGAPYELNGMKISPCRPYLIQFNAYRSN